MSLINTPLAEQIRIVITGLRNAGKSSLFNSLLENNLAIVSEVPGTTTDPVTKSMEMGKLGPVAFTDTAGIDDIGKLGKLRISKTYEILKIADIILFVTKINDELTDREIEFYDEIKKLNKKVIVVFTYANDKENISKINFFNNEITVKIDNKNNYGINKLKETLVELSEHIDKEIKPLDGLVKEGDLIMLVVPIDTAAPKGRLILPQVETIRDALDKNCQIIITKENDVKKTYNNLIKKPNLVITDSQAFDKVALQIPKKQNLTSFSILFARKKGNFDYFLDSLKYLKKSFIEPGSKIMVLESCTHHRQPDDIGTVKIPNLFKKHIQNDVKFEFFRELPENEKIKEFKIAIFCAGCMVTRNKILERLKVLAELNIPVINYGLFLAFVNKLIPRAIMPLINKKNN